jgi:hypothetical protein
MAAFGCVSSGGCATARVGITSASRIDRIPLFMAALSPHWAAGDHPSAPNRAAISKIETADF